MGMTQELKVMTVLDARLEKHGRTWDEIRYPVLCYAVKLMVGNWGGTKEDYSALVIDIDNVFGLIPIPGFTENKKLYGDLLSTLDHSWSQSSSQAGKVCLAHMILYALPESALSAASYEAVQDFVHGRLLEIRDRRSR